ncbi:maleylacetate reductase [Cryobacterium cryoconiti]|uniref:Maleylacetate reductase n=1 Tax=Cryobacterium cryoconiti TaxID=1259239 RepID=A0A4Y8JW72_9MICO|nr:maleylacetate reductase [Cryobacterium cryoconiti]TFD31317.1 maleylacetate reductase [Cryobacterium cryoconiti]
MEQIPGTGDGPERGPERGSGRGSDRGLVDLDFEYRSQRQRVLFGTGRAADLLATVLGELGAPRVMVIATRRELERSAAVLGGIRAVVVFDEVVQHVPAESAERAHRAAGAAGIDVVVALGGGSAIGLAKILALWSERPGGLPIVAVPTTYSGSEATAVWGLTRNGVKTTGFNPRVLPGTVIYDAALTLSLPRELRVSSALNALAHGVDALWAPGANPVSALIAAEGIRMLARALPRIAPGSGSGSGHQEALYGAYLSASAFSSTGSGLHHKICHVLGGSFGLPHAQTHSIVLPHVVELNAPAAPEAEARIAGALGSPTAVEGLLALRDRVQGPTALRDVGLKEPDVARAVALILPTVPASNPCAVTPDDLTRLLRNAWAGTAPLPQ